MADITILVVDDDTELRNLLGDYLRKNGYQVTLAADGKDMRKNLDKRQDRSYRARFDAAG